MTAYATKAGEGQIAQLKVVHRAVHAIKMSLLPAASLSATCFQLAMGTGVVAERPEIASAIRAGREMIANSRPAEMERLQWMEVSSAMTETPGRMMDVALPVKSNVDGSAVSIRALKCVGTDCAKVQKSAMTATQKMGMDATGIVL